MGRKNLFAGLIDAELPAGNLPADSGPKPAPVDSSPLAGLGSRGAIGAVTRSIEQMRAQSVVDLPSHMIDASFINDRLGASAEAHQALVESIREHGQQVPILVRPHPEKEGRYQIAYGRRRLRALAELGRPVRAVIKPLSDEQLVLAQGQENSARTDLSFIEKALFAARLEEGGFSREIIMASLAVDKTGLSRLISAAIKIPRGIIEAIGPAPKAGRDRWSELATRLESASGLAAAETLIGTDAFTRKASDERFAAVFQATAPRSAKLPRPVLRKAKDGTTLARINEDERNVTLAFDKRTIGAFAAYLVEALPDVYAAFRRRSDYVNPDEKDKTPP